MQTKVEKSRKGWQVFTYDKDQCNWQAVAVFISQTAAYAYAYTLEHGL